MRRIDPQAFNRRRNGNRRRDDAVGQQERAADDRRIQKPSARITLDQRVKRKNSAFAAIVGTQRDQDVFDRRQKSQRPKNRRKSAERKFRHNRPRSDNRRHRIKRRSSNIAENNAESHEQTRKRDFFYMLMMCV